MSPSLNLKVAVQHRDRLADSAGGVILDPVRARSPGHRAADLESPVNGITADVLARIESDASTAARWPTSSTSNCEPDLSGRVSPWGPEAALEKTVTYITTARRLCCMIESTMPALFAVRGVRGGRARCRDAHGEVGLRACRRPDRLRDLPGVRRCLRHRRHVDGGRGDVDADRQAARQAGRRPSLRPFFPPRRSGFRWLFLAVNGRRTENGRWRPFRQVGGDGPVDRSQTRQRPVPKREATDAAIWIACPALATALN